MHEVSPEIAISFPFTLWHRIRAAFALVPQRKLSLGLALLMPALAMLLLGLMAATDRLHEPRGWLLVLVLLSFYPVIVLIAAVAGHYGNAHMREPFNYTFDDAGIHVAATSYTLTHRWSTISHVKQSGGFLMFFFSPGCAHCFPIEVVQAAGVRNALLELAARHGARIERRFER